MFIVPREITGPSRLSDGRGIALVEKGLIRVLFGCWDASHGRQAGKHGPTVFAYVGRRAVSQPVVSCEFRPDSLVACLLLNICWKTFLRVL